jgi:hypothetical protein
VVLGLLYRDGAADGLTVTSIWTLPNMAARLKAATHKSAFESLRYMPVTRALSDAKRELYADGVTQSWRLQPRRPRQFPHSRSGRTSGVSRIVDFWPWAVTESHAVRRPSRRSGAPPSCRRP